ncbi:gamma-glutamylcyclotransferase [Actinoallomurus sp. NPDC052274]|uniref:allophanate hydrolase-related protein n=1 Tax=Actinoallomurus sp. NPDC052274 TaxID=3155420 RepID=UPI00342AC741
MPLMFLNGGGMRGGPLHHLLDGAPQVAATTTAPRYRLYSVADRFPALLPVAHGGAPVTGEVYDVTLDVLRDRLLPAEPPELELGVIELADGTSSLAMVLRRPPASFPQLLDITDHGGWAAYRRTAP